MDNLRLSPVSEISEALIKAKFAEIQNATVCDTLRPIEEVHLYSAYSEESDFRKFFRYDDIPCIKSTTVFDGDNEFFHGNYVKYKSMQAILTQCPVSSSLNRFWRIVKEKGAVVFDLTNQDDKPSIYRPSFCKKFDKLKVFRLPANHIGSSFSLYRFSIEEAGDSIETDNINYYEWKDGDTAKSCSDLIHLINLVRSYLTKGKYPIIHCMAGMGRSGSLFTLLCATNEILEHEIDSSNLLDKLQEIILACRPQRASLFVQSYKQFASIVRTCESILRDPSQIRS